MIYDLDLQLCERLRARGGVRPVAPASIERAGHGADGRERVAFARRVQYPRNPHMGQRSAQKTDGAGSVATLGKSSRSNWSVMRSGAKSAARRFKAPASCSAGALHSSPSPSHRRRRREPVVHRGRLLRSRRARTGNPSTRWACRKPSPRSRQWGGPLGRTTGRRDLRNDNRDRDRASRRAKTLSATPSAAAHSRFAARTRPARRS